MITAKYKSTDRIKKSEGKWPFGRWRRRREDNISEYIEERACEDVSGFNWFRPGIGGELL